MPHLKYKVYITRQEIREAPDVLFVFGDNMARKGYGGQAREMRGEPNAVGIPTKKYPSMSPEAFLRDADFLPWLAEYHAAEMRLLAHPGLVIWPANGIGTGLARLQDTAPTIWNQLETLRLRLESLS